MSIRQLIQAVRYPRALVDSILTYPRLGTIKPGLLAGSEHEQRTLLSVATTGWWPKKLMCPLGQRILAVSAHADDETIGAGGLLIAHRGKADISVVTVFDGAAGGALDQEITDPVERKARMIDRRWAELDQACRHFDGRCTGRLDVAEETAVFDSAIKERFRRMVDEARPEVVVMPWFLDGHADHRAVNRLWAETCSDLSCMVLGAEIWSPLPLVNAIVDITDVLPQKLAAISEFTSQLATVDYIAFAEGQARMRAFHGAVRERRSGAAEAFLALPNRDYCDLVARASA